MSAKNKSKTDIDQNRYACLVAEPTASVPEHEDGVVGVVDVTVLSEEAVLQHLPGAEEYLYVSGIAVSERFRSTSILPFHSSCSILTS